MAKFIKLNIQNWKIFAIGRLFDIKKGKRLTSDDQEEGDNIYVGAIDSNNGVANHISQKPIHEGNTISLSYNGSVGEAFYQPDPYWATDDVNVLYSKYKGFNQEIGLFIATVIRQNKYRFSYGRKWTLDNMKISKIRLPVQYNDNGSVKKDPACQFSDEGYIPDWKFMEDYIKSLHHKPITTKNKAENKIEFDFLKWKEFYFGDLISDIYKTKAINKDELSENSEKAGSIQYITRTAENNGCEMLAVRSDVADCLIEKGNAITIGDTTATCFYQEEEFITGDHMVVVRADSWLNKYTGLFIVAILQCEQYKYSYGRAFIMEKIKNTIIKLPADQDGKPDWNFMEDYIKSLHYVPLTTKKKSITSINLKVNEWQKFQIKKIFTLLNGKSITQEEISENPGTLSAVQSGEDNNGVMGYIDLNYCKNMKYTYSEKPCLTVARTGSAGFVSFQKNGCVVGDSAKILLLPDEVASTGVYLFLQTILNENRFKYTYGRKVTEEKYLNDYLVLPVQKEGDRFLIDEECKYSDEGYVPDWKFMENYIKSLPYGDRI